MSRAVTTARNLVTSNDDLLSSLEGVECILLEGLCENYAGNLRRSWLAARRAVTLAQMLGLDRGAKPLSLTGTAIAPDEMWFRVLQFERYLCLMLSLPQSICEDSFTSPQALATRTALERFQRLTCVAAGRLLKRSASEIYDRKTTREIDKLLQDASAMMPAQWWVSPSSSMSPSRMDKLGDTLRFNDHFMHYHLLVHLHLPYLLRPRSERECEYNKMTAVTSSREVLSRLAAFRASHSIGYYCRGVDSLASISSTALTLAHIMSDHGRGADQDGSHFLDHQRLSDRGMLEQNLAIMREIASLYNDAIATRAVTLLQHLLSIEEVLASGAASYQASMVQEPREGGDLGCVTKLSEDGMVLSIFLPHLGAVKIERQDDSREATLRATPPIGVSQARNTQRGWDQPLLSIGGSEGDRISLQSQQLSSPQATSLVSRDVCENSQGLSNEAVDLGSWAIDDVDLGFLDACSFTEGESGCGELYNL